MIGARPEINLSVGSHIENVYLQKKVKKFIATANVTCIRIRTARLKRERIARIVNITRALNVSDLPIILENNISLVKDLKVNGVHLTDGIKSITKAQEFLGKTFIIGSYCGSSKHYGMIAAEQGADYVSFAGGVSNSEQTRPNVELFEWWFKFINTPIMAEPIILNEVPHEVKKYCDFVLIEDGNWLLN